MKRYGALLLTVLMVWSLAAPVMAAGNPFPDVPVNHWAYDSISKLAAAGLVIGYPDGTFGGQRTLTRYEMAMVFARILDRLEIWIENKFAAAGDELEADIYKKVTDDLMAEVDSLRNAISEIPEQTVVERIVEKPVRQVVETTVVEKPFELTDESKAVLADFIAQELVDEVAWMAEHENRIAALESSAATAGDLARTQAAIAALEGDVDAVQSYIESEVEAIGAELAALSTEFKSELEVVGIRVKNLENIFAKLDERVVALEKATAENSRKIAENADKIAANSAKIADNSKQIAANTEKINVLTADVDELKKEADKAYYQNLGQDADIAGLDSRVQNLELASTEVSAINAEVAALRDKLNSLRFGGSLEVEYADDEDEGDTLTYTLNLEAAKPTDVATLKATAAVSAESLGEDNEPTLDLTVAAEDIKWIGMDWYLELANEGINSGDSSTASFNFGVAKDFTMMSLPTTFAIDQSIVLNEDDSNTTDFTLTFNKFLLDNLSASVGYSRKEAESNEWSTGFELGIGASTLSLDWAQDDEERTTDLSLVVPVIKDVVDWTIGGGVTVDRADDSDTFNWNTGVEVKF